MRRQTARTSIFLLAVLVTTIGQAEEAAYDVISENLANPRAVAIQPKTGHVFVAESAALRIVRIVDGKSEEVVSGFAKDYTGKSPIYEIGPLSLLFLDRDTLLIGGGGHDAGMDQIFVVNVPKAGEPSVLIKRNSNRDLRLQSQGKRAADGNFWSMARFDDHVFVTCGENIRQGWVARAQLRDGQPETLRRFFSTVRAAEAIEPHGITVSPEGDLAIAQSGDARDSKDSKLLFFSPEGDFLDKFETGLNDLYGIAYGPNSGRLFGVDFNHADPNNGGLYKLVGTREGCRAVRFATLQRPSALTFADNGDLYVTTVGRFVEGAESANGQLLRFRGLDVSKTTANGKAK